MNKIISVIKLIAPSFLIFGCLLMSENFTLNTVKEQNFDFWNMGAAEFGALGDGMGDAQTYVHNARYMLGLEPGDPGLWREINVPPGFPIIIATVIGLTGDGHYFVKMLVVSVLFWTLLWSLFFHWFKFVENPALRLLIILLISMMPRIKDVIVGDGYIHSEGTGLAVLGLTLIFLYRGIYLRSAKWVLFSALMFAVTAHFRGLFDAINFGMFLTVTGLIFLSVMFRSQIVLAKRNLSGSFKNRMEILKLEALAPSFTSLKIAVGCLLIYFVAVAPWKTHVKNVAGVYLMAGHAGIEFMLHWKPSHMQPGLVKTGNTACLVDPKLCEIVQAQGEALVPYMPKLSLMTLLTHPKQWVGYKLKNINWFWVGLDWNDVSRDNLAIWFEAIVYLLAAIFCFVYPWLGSTGVLRSSDKLNNSRLIEVFMVTFGMALTHFALILIIHFEQRYSLGLRLFYLLTALYLIYLRRLSLAQSKKLNI